MRFLNILHAINFEPWLIVPEVHAQLAALVESKLAGDASSLSERATAGKNIFGDPLPQMSISDGIATIPISGPIGKGLGNLEKSCGATSIEDVQRNLAEASSRKDVRGVLLSINSPGGSITGIPETASMIARLRETKPVVAFTDGMMASAAYWLGSQADAVVASTSAQVGSIGVYIPWADQTRRYEAAGVKVGVVKNKEGTYKGAGYPGTALTEEQMAHLQERADEIFAMLKADILAQRKRVPDSSMKGQVFIGRSAQAAGLVDAIGNYGDAWREVDAMSRVRPV